MERLTKKIPDPYTTQTNKKNTKTIDLRADKDIFQTTNSENGRFYYKGDLFIENSAPAGENLDLKTSLFVEGDVYIMDDIYNNNGQTWHHPAQIGYITIISKGNIHVDGRVTHLDAMLVAQPDPTAPDDTGRLWTCVDAGAFQNGSWVASSTDHWHACQDQLVINGSLVANNIHLGRIGFTLEHITVLETSSHEPGPGNRAGEEINLLPEYYLGSPSLPVWDEWLYEKDSFSVSPLNL